MLATFFGGRNSWPAALLIAGVLATCGIAVGFVLWQTSSLHADAIATCRIANAARADSNEHLRRPLKTIGLQAADVLDAAAATASRHGQARQSAATQKIADAFRQAANKVTYLPQLNCQKLNGS